MPDTKIEVRRRRSPEEIAALIDAVYQAQREALQVLEDDRQIRHIEHKPEHFAVPPGKSENYTVVEILYKGIVGRFGKLGVQPKYIFTVLSEPQLENWGIRGGVPASEVDLGFNLEV